MNIIELEILCNSIDETEKFYKNNFGLRVISITNDKIAFKIGTTSLIFKEAKEYKPVYHFAIDVPNNRFEDAFKFFEATTPLLPVTGDNVIADFKNWEAKSFYFYDNNGNIVEIITRYHNHTVSDEPFTGSSYLCVSEIGLVAGNVPELADKIEQDYNVPIFHRQPRGERFTVCGDDEGLFVLAQEGRDWFPTNVKAHSFFTRVLFYNEGVTHSIER